MSVMMRLSTGVGLSLMLAALSGCGNSGSKGEDDVAKFCRQKLTGYKVPKYIEFRDDLPKTNVGKILRRELRAGK